MRIAALVMAGLLLSSAVFAAETPPHTIAVAGEAELLLPPDYASVELGVVTQAPSVTDALAENSSRMTRAVAAIKSLGISDSDIQTSTIHIQPRYQKSSSDDYEEAAFRTIVGYSIANKVTVKVRDVKGVAKVVDETVKAGANSTGRVSFNVNSLSDRLDDARRSAVENARHKAEILTGAAKMRLGPAISITDNQADTSYDSEVGSSINQTVVVSASRIATPIEPGLVTIRAVVTVVYSTR